MYSVCLNTALTYKRKQKREKTESLAPSHYQIAEQPSDDKEAAINILFEVIATLSPLNKAITLLYLESMSYEEIASITGLTKSNVSVRLVRIKKELEEKMKSKFNTTENENA
jgi:RNA polymerase sigma-70 factor (ECF subfamily)